MANALTGLPLYSALAEQVYRRAYTQGAADQPLTVGGDGNPSGEPSIGGQTLVTPASLQIATDPLAVGRFLTFGDDRYIYDKATGFVAMVTAATTTWRSAVADQSHRKKARLYADSGYQGYDKDHRNLEFPYKKPKNGKLADGEKEYNRGLSAFRVRVEHRIGQTNRFPIAAERYRNPLGTHPMKISIVAGLVNLEDGFGPF